MALQPLRNYYQPAPPVPNSNNAQALTIPEIAQAFQNDPRHQLAQRMMETGSSGAPVAAGGWAWADGLARALQGISGGFLDRSARRRALRDQEGVMNDFQGAIGGTDATSGDAANKAPPGNNAPYYISPDTPPQGGFQPQPVKPPAVMPPQAPPPAQPAAPPMGVGASAGPDTGPSPQELAAALVDASPAAGRIPGGPYNPIPGMPQQSEAAPIPMARPMGVGARPIPAARAPSLNPTQTAAASTLYSEFRNIGWTDEGARTMVAQVGRETGFDPKHLFGTHTDHNNRATNVGIASYQGGRNAALMDFMTQHGFVQNGRIVPSEGALRAQAQFADQEMRSRYPQSAAAVRDPNGSYAQIEPVLSNNYFGWDRAGRHINARDHLNRMAGYYQAVSHGVAGTATAMQQPAAGPPQAPPAQGASPPVNYAIQQVETPAPAAVAQPKAPALPAPVESQRMQMGMALLKSGNPYLFQQARTMLDAGMGEQFQARSTAQQQAFDQGQTGYQSQLGDYTSSHSQGRAATYDMRQSERNEGFAQTRQGRDHQFNRDERIGGQQFQHGERQDQNQFTDYERVQGQQDNVNLHNIDNSAADHRTQMQIEAARATREERRANFLQTPAGARIADAAEQTVRANQTVIDAAQQFLELNEHGATGGASNNVPLVSTLNRINSPMLQQMEALTSRISPLIRQAGSGSMSDRDLENFRRSVPNIQNSADANRENGQRLIAGFRRMNEYETARVQAMAEGNTTTFMRQWQGYARQHSIDDNVSFEQYQASIPTYNAQGQRQ